MGIGIQTTATGSRLARRAVLYHSAGLTLRGITKPYNGYKTQRVHAADNHIYIDDSDARSGSDFALDAAFSFVCSFLQVSAHAVHHVSCRIIPHFSGCNTRSCALPSSEPAAAINS